MSGCHVPVLIEEVCAALQPLAGACVLDATFGGGGYTRRFLDAGATVHAFDRDPGAIAAVRDDPATWPEALESPPRLVLHQRRFSEMGDAMREAGVRQVDAIAMDIGVSSMQIDQAERGFAFQADGPLDMRMSREGPSAADFVNEASETEIADVLYRFGEERQSRRLARAIVAARPLSTTGELAALVRKALGHRPGAPKDPATRTFQALRIAVNDELAELEAGLAAAEALLCPGGRLGIVCFHSLEDRIAKHFLREASGATAAGSRHVPVLATGPTPTFQKVSKGIQPRQSEIDANPRSRSATLRSAVRTDAPARERIAA